MTSPLHRLLPAGLVFTLAIVLSGCASAAEIGREAIGGSCCAILWVVLAVTALLDIWRGTRPDSEKLIWTVVIVIIPVAGAIAYHLLAKGKS